MLYFIGTKGRIKIGFSIDPLERRNDLQPGNPDKLKVLLAIHLENEKEIEQLLHENLSFCRQQGEWFNISFATALEQLFSIRKRLNTGDNLDIPLENEPKPKLEDFRIEFEELIRKTFWNDREWDQHLCPLESYWREYRDEFLKSGKIECPPDDPAEKFRFLRESLKAIPPRSS